MVRLVFRPYTQVRKAICTSAHLRASTRVSSGFALLRHSSPSFGSQQVYSYSNLSHKIMVGRWCRLPFPPLSFLAPRELSTHRLAHMLDSLVRVSRRAGLVPSANDLGLRPRSRSMQVRGRTPPLPPRVTPVDRTCPEHALQRTQLGTSHVGIQTASLPTISGTFYSLFKVLFIFPSQYLFAIGFLHIFSLRRSLSPA